MAWGFFKKLVIADRLGLYVNDVYASPQNFIGLQLTIATVFFGKRVLRVFQAAVGAFWASRSGCAVPSRVFPIGLQTVPRALEQGGDGARTHRMALLG